MRSIPDDHTLVRSLTTTSSLSTTLLFSGSCSKERYHEPSFLVLVVLQNASTMVFAVDVAPTAIDAVFSPGPITSSTLQDIESDYGNAARSAACINLAMDFGTELNFVGVVVCVGGAAVFF